NINSFKEEVKQLAYVKGATGSNRVPGLELGRAFDVHREGVQDGSRHVLRNWGVNYDFLKLYQIKLLAGRDFTRNDHRVDFANIQSLILNESAVKLLGFASPQDAIGKRITAFNKGWEVIGVTTDFHQKSLRHPVEATFFMPTFSPTNSFS